MEIFIQEFTAGYSKNKPAVKVLNLHILNSDNVVLIEGQNSSGKTTFLKSLVGVVPYSTGEIYFDEELFCKSNREDFLLKIGCCFIPGLAVENYNLKENFNLYKLLYPDYSIDFLEELVDLLEFEPYKNLKTKTLSLGKRKIADFIIALLNKPRLVLLDEPTANLDEQNLQIFIHAIEYLSLNYDMQFLITTNHTFSFTSILSRRLKIENGVIV